MNIDEKIDALEKLDTEIEEFFCRVCKYYLQGSPTCTVIRSGYEYVNFTYCNPGMLKINISDRYENYSSFKVSSDILTHENWVPILDNMFIEEQKELDVKSALNREKRETKEREEFERLNKKYGMVT
jgi:hypothetical protein